MDEAAFDREVYDQEKRDLEDWARDQDDQERLAGRPTDEGGS